MNGDAAHKAAYKHNIIHRDISCGNILLYRDKKGNWKGLLNDWELSKSANPGDYAGRQHDRTVCARYYLSESL